MGLMYNLINHFTITTTRKLLSWIGSPATPRKTSTKPRIIWQCYGNEPPTHIQNWLQKIYLSHTGHWESSELLIYNYLKWRYSPLSSVEKDKKFINIFQKIVLMITTLPWVARRSDILTSTQAFFFFLSQVLFDNPLGYNVRP